MNRIDSEFSRLREFRQGGFIPFVVAGDPDLATTRDVVTEISRAGANVIELGIPFSDPVADGPTIQAAAERALRHSVSVGDVLGVVRDVRAAGCETPIILFSYFNPVLQFGIREFAARAAECGVDGVLITDLIPEEAAEFQSILASYGLHLIMLAAPTSGDDRLRKIAELAGGFVYAVSRAGVTGARGDLSGDAESLVARIREHTSLPVAVGFGISTPEQVSETWDYADAAVVGSAIVSEIARLADSGVSGSVAAKIGEFAAALCPREK